MHYGNTTNVQFVPGYQDFGPYNKGLGQYDNRQNPAIIAMLKGEIVKDGSKIHVACAGEVREAKDMEDAQRIAEELAHSKSANAYILKPVRMVAPKRDVVSTDL